jgi:hypothetical protein
VYQYSRWNFYCIESVLQPKGRVLWYWVDPEWEGLEHQEYGYSSDFEFPAEAEVYWANFPDFWYP